MTATKRRIEIFVEQHRTLRASNRQLVVVAWCERCGGRVRMVTPDEAAALARVVPRTIYAWVEAGQVHFTETADRLVFICPNSLPK